MLSAMALPGCAVYPSGHEPPSVTSNAARKQSEIISLSGSEPGTNPVRKILASASSLRHPISLACASWDAGPGPVSARPVPRDRRRCKRVRCLIERTAVPWSTAAEGKQVSHRASGSLPVQGPWNWPPSPLARLWASPSASPLPSVPVWRSGSGPPVSGRNELPGSPGVPGWLWLPG